MDGNFSICSKISKAATLSLRFIAVAKAKSQFYGLRGKVLYFIEVFALFFYPLPQGTAFPVVRHGLFTVSAARAVFASNT
ncbi:MAG: hypothetical protein KGI27_00095 [Thaumarchaeota archaeon]|nr:hypothetical protein [Nitrososphaerota archaeon]